MSSTFQDEDLKDIAVDNFAKTELSIIKLVGVIFFVLVLMLIIWFILKKNKY